VATTNVRLSNKEKTPQIQTDIYGPHHLLQTNRTVTNSKRGQYLILTGVVNGSMRKKKRAK